MKNLSGLMKQAQQMQEACRRCRRSWRESKSRGSSGAGLVTVTLNGKGEMKRLKIDPKLADPAEMEMLEDLIVAAHTDAKRKVEANAATEMQKVTAGMQLPPGMKLPF